jgi:F-box domain
MGKPVSSILLSLSPEVLVEILFLLPARDIVACSRTCHLLHTLVLETQLLQYIIYTHCAGVDDRFPRGLTVPQRFAFLERWEEAWRDSDGLDPSGGRVKLMNPAGLKTQSMLRDGFLVVAHFKVEAEDKGMAGYSAIDLRSPSMGWRRTDIPCHIIAFDCSIEQNLVATLHMYVIPLTTTVTDSLKDC